MCIEVIKCYYFQKCNLPSLHWSNFIFYLSIYFFLGYPYQSLILADSLTKNFFQMDNIHVITRHGSTPAKMTKFVRESPGVVKNYDTIVIHVGTNWMSTKEEWGLFLKMINSVISPSKYRAMLNNLNPPPATGDALRFRN